MHLHRQGTRFGRSLSLPGGLLTQFAEILAADAVRQFRNGFHQVAVLHQQLEVHFRLSPQTGNRLQEGLAIGSNGTPQSFVGIKYGAKTERKDGQSAEAFADDAGMVNDCLLGEGLFGA